MCLEERLTLGGHLSDTSPIIVWIRRDLRLSDHPALSSAFASGRPIIPVFICDEAVKGLGAAPKWRLGLGVEHFANRLDAFGSRLTLRSGDALACLTQLIEDTGAGAVYWVRAYDPAAVERDTVIKTTLQSNGLEVQSFNGSLLFEPWTVKTGAGGFYRVYTPFWNSVKGRDVASPLPVPKAPKAPARFPLSDDLTDWALGAAMRRGAAVVRPFVRLGEAAALERLEQFTAGPVADYMANRDFPGLDATSCLSENLALGEISPRQCWHAGMRAMHEGKAGAETFLKEVVWREFAYHLMWHTPHILTQNWRPDWDAFPWRTDPDSAEVMAWKQGRTGIPFVDAAMRELYVTGRMHNRARMIVASYLTKHLLCHWQIGRDWFEDCLIDWDPASNAMGWQWSAGSGPDATPYFRVFNPVTQLDKFDKNRAYADRWIAEGKQQPHKDALLFFAATPLKWSISPSDPYPKPIVPADVGRKRALEAYENRGF